MQRKILYSYLGELRMILFILIASVCFSILNAQDILFEENFEAASGAENILDNYLGWESGEFDNTTNNNYFWVFDNTRTTVISGSYSMAVSENNPVNSSTTEYKDNQAASTLVYHTTPIDASNYINLTLDFKWIGLGETIFDSGRVMYSLDANTWTELAVYEGETTVQTITNLDLSDVDQESFYIGFGWENDGSIGGFPGFIVDDIIVKGTFTTNTTCQPSTDSSEECYIDDVQFVGTLNDVNTLNSSYGNSDGYQDWTGEIKSIQAQGEGINIIADAGGRRGAWKAWVDWNQDDQFDMSEEVYGPEGSYGLSAVFGFVIPDNQPPGDYRIRIRIGINIYLGYEYFYDFNACEDFNNTTYFGVPDYYFGEAEDFLFTVIEKCDSYISSVTNGEACGSNQSIDLSFIGTGNTTVTGFNIYTNETGGAPLTPAPTISGVTGSWTTPNISETTTYWITATSSCSNGESLVRTPVTAYISPVPEISITPSNPTICGGDNIVAVSASGDFETVYLINEKFESGLGDFVNINNDSNTPAVANVTQWQTETSTLNTFSGNVWSPAISSGINNNKFALATSDHINSSTSSADIIDNSITLVNAVSTENFESLTLRFDIFYLRYFENNYVHPTYDEYVDIDISIDDGNNWITLERLEEDIGYGNNFINKSYDLSGYLNETQIKIRVRHYSWATDDDGLGWLPDGVAIDNVELFGTKPLNPMFSWTGDIDVYTDASAQTEYIDGEMVETLYIKPSATQLMETNFSFTVHATLTNGCEVEENIPIINNTKTWNDAGEVDWFDGSKWIPAGEPTIYSCVIIHNNVELPDTAVRTGFAKSVTITSSGNLEITEGKTLTVVDQIKIDSGGELIVKDDASLVQVTDVASNENEGTITMERKVENVDNLDYVYWSSSVDAFNVEEISSNATSEPIYEWIPTIGDAYGNWQAASGTMNIGKGYIVRGLSTVSPANTAIFQGVANNGIIEAPIQRGLYNGEGYINPINGVEVLATDDNWNLIGNPYPSSISANKFTNDNTSIDGTIYLWNYNSSPSVDNDDPFYDDFTYNYDENNYIEHNNTGSNPPGTDDLFIASGQAFFVLMLETAPQSGVVTFSNTMRKSTYDNSNFYGPNFETDDILEKQRIWLDLINSDNLALSILIGYVEGATDSNDRLYDAYEMAGSAFSFYSLSNSEKMSIQGKSLPFNISDYVTLGANFPENGNYTIAINTLDGVFEQGNQNIYLQDTYLDIIHNLKLTPYNFNSESGSFDDRFVLRYTNTTLNTKDYDTKTQIDVLAYHNNLKVESETILINKVIIYDTQGRLVQTFSNINSLSFKKKTLNLNSSSYLVNIILENGQVYNKKVVFN